MSQDLLDTIENRTFDEIQVGDSATLVRTLRPEDIQMLAIISGDMNPTHVDPEYARSSQFREVVAHGMWGAMLFRTFSARSFLARAPSMSIRTCISTVPCASAIH